MIIKKVKQYFKQIENFNVTDFSKLFVNDADLVNFFNQFESFYNYNNRIARYCDEKLADKLMQRLIDNLKNDSFDYIEACSIECADCGHEFLKEELTLIAKSQKKEEYLCENCLMKIKIIAELKTQGCEFLILNFSNAVFHVYRLPLSIDFIGNSKIRTSFDNKLLFDLFSEHLEEVKEIKFTSYIWTGENSKLLQAKSYVFNLESI